MIAMMVQEFVWDLAVPVEEIKESMGLTMSSANGLPIHVKPCAD